MYRSAFVTGAGGGLGQAFTRMLLEEGVAVWGTARDPARLAGLFPEGAFTAVALDLADGDAAERAFLRAAGEAPGGAFDLVIQNAGYGVFGSFSGTEWKHWRSQLDAMLVTTARLSHAALAAWGSRAGGTLVHVTSLAAEFPIPFMAGYNAAKAGLAALSESLDLETRGGPVRVIDFRPGDYLTGFNRALSHPGGSPAGADRPETAASARVWERLEANLASAPAAEHAAAALRRALLSGRRGTFRCGGFFQARLAPFLTRFAPTRLRICAIARYFHLRD